MLSGNDELLSSVDWVLPGNGRVRSANSSVLSANT